MSMYKAVAVKLLRSIEQWKRHQKQQQLNLHTKQAGDLSLPDSKKLFGIDSGH